MTCCPQCGSSHRRSNRIDERPYAEAAMQASYLRHYGEIEEAERLLTERFRVWLENFKRLRWRCQRCHTPFD